MILNRQKNFDTFLLSRFWKNEKLQIQLNVAFRQNLFEDQIRCLKIIFGDAVVGYLLNKGLHILYEKTRNIARNQLFNIKNGVLWRAMRQDRTILKRVQQCVLNHKVKQ
ncbi:Hypothetical_protein [Hexamita inflata]|uniref:Hypothetical_protein n=1 Tax=Hexamita inflata TaxID=28002 RepID=A0AA86TDV9_9EUKA|nr:Hypothetical protein HINF_LOCUS3614 [Hexamita inflata]CAI9915976.1 Hypothetical protein HINF_LOCUS3621 [Hexamita inflata]CAI9915978.1 Hypothetical protein HINF_LOCUS3623 [Hexamita inflata]